MQTLLKCLTQQGGQGEWASQLSGLGNGSGHIPSTHCLNNRLCEAPPLRPYSHSFHLEFTASKEKSICTSLILPSSSSNIFPPSNISVCDNVLKSFFYSHLFFKEVLYCITHEYLLQKNKHLKNSKYYAKRNVTVCDKNLTYNLFGNSVFNWLGLAFILQMSSSSMVTAYIISDHQQNFQRNNH